MAKTVVFPCNFLDAFTHILLAPDLFIYFYLYKLFYLMLMPKQVVLLQWAVSQAKLFKFLQHYLESIKTVNISFTCC